METVHNDINLCALFDVGVDATCVSNAVHKVPNVGPSSFSSASQINSLMIAFSRNSTAFKSIEEKVGGAVSNVKVASS